MARSVFCLLPFPSISTISLAKHSRSNVSKSCPLSGDSSHYVLCFKKKRLTTVKMPGVMSLMSSNGIDSYRLHTSRLQKPCISPSISDKDSINSSGFLRCAGTYLSNEFSELAKYLDKDVAGVSVAACIGLPFNSPCLWSLGKQYTGHGSGSVHMLDFRFLLSCGWSLVFLSNFI